MRRPLWFRALVAVWGIWLTTALTERSRFFVCTMHGEGAAAASAMSAMSAMGSGAAGSAAVPVDDTRQDRTDVCTCADECCGAAFVASPVRATELQVAALVSAPVARYASVERADAPREHVLPFANAPPTPIAL